MTMAITPAGWPSARSRIPELPWACSPTAAVERQQLAWVSSLGISCSCDPASLHRLAAWPCRLPLCDRRVSQAKLLRVLQDGGVRFVAVPGSRTPIAAHVASGTAYHGEFWPRATPGHGGRSGLLPTGVRRIR